MIDNVNETLEVLTGQPITVSLGGKSYTVRRASLYDIGAMNRFKKEKIGKGDDANIDLDSIFFLLSELMKPHHNIDPDTLAKSIPFENYPDVIDALKKAGFKPPQTEKK